ncbi:hypothetical protein Tdes44962_MAKER07609 [Teratosphaeria destructans]|uniref:Secreted protein n=1 Tax=Teratosphaeria destructans TaxID=418781 RepID=A0A9W7SYR5_9PEZI|nr:hypothetical protein Tdes44962_MAKER07609 [Teratosphaeria destructans]
MNLPVRTIVSFSALIYARTVAAFCRGADLRGDGASVGGREICEKRSEGRKKRTPTAAVRDAKSARAILGRCVFGGVVG